MSLDRRRFLLVLGSAAVASRDVLRSADPRAANSAGAPVEPDTAPWHQKIRRVGQLNFNERDPLEIDVADWGATWTDLKVDAVLVSVTGMVAFYPTRVPFHRRSRFLAGRDLFGECCAEAKRWGIRVIARFSPDLQWQEALDAHPEWFLRDAKGQPVPHPEVPGLFQTCMFSTYYTEHTPAIMREINARYTVDGFFTNAWPQLDRFVVCHCDACRNAPPPDTPAFRAYHMTRTVELWDRYAAIAREKHPENIFFGNLGSGIHAVHDLKALAEHCQWFNCDNQGRGGEDTPAWGCAQQGRVARSVMKGRTITNVTGAWATGRVRWRNAAKNQAEATLWMAQTVASGMRVWYHWLGAQTGLGEDRRWRKAGRDFLRWQARHDPHFTYRRPMANLGVVFAQRPNSFYSAPGATDTPRSAGQAEFIQGLYLTLLEGRLCFDFVHEDDLGADSLRSYAALILPNVALLSDEQCRQLRAYVEAGGSLLATFETGLYDEKGARRGDFALGDLFGIARAGEVQGPVGQSFYARIERPHEILRGFANTNWIPGAEYRVPVRAANHKPVLTVVPAYTDYPPEMVYARPEERTDEPALVTRESGASRLLYFPGDVERSAWRSGNTDVARLLLNSIRWLLRGQTPVTVGGEGLVELFAWETDPGFAVHILNYNNPNLHRGWFRRHYPIGPQTVKIEIPGGKRIMRVQLLRAEQDLPFTQNGGHVEFTIPAVTDYEVAALST